MLSHDVLPSAIRESMGASNVGPSMMRPTSVHNETDGDDSDEDDNIV